MPKVRAAIHYLARHTRRAWDRRHPLISARLETDGPSCFSIAIWANTLSLRRFARLE